MFLVREVDPEVMFDKFHDYFGEKTLMEKRKFAAFQGEKHAVIKTICKDFYS